MKIVVRWRLVMRMAGALETSAQAPVAGRPRLLDTRLWTLLETLGPYFRLMIFYPMSPLSMRWTATTEERGNVFAPSGKVPLGC